MFIIKGSVDGVLMEPSVLSKFVITSFSIMVKKSHEMKEFMCVD